MYVCICIYIYMYAFTFLFYAMLPLPLVLSHLFVYQDILALVERQEQTIAHALRVLAQEKVKHAEGQLVRLPKMLFPQISYS